MLDSALNIKHLNLYIESHGTYENDDLLTFIKNSHERGIDSIAVEMIASMGMPVGKEIFETCLFIGQIKECWKWVCPVKVLGTGVVLIYRKDIKMHLCGSMRAKDSNIRAALIDRFGKPGTKKQKGILYGIKADEWSALAIAVTFYDIHNTGQI